MKKNDISNSEWDNMEDIMRKTEGKYEKNEADSTSNKGKWLMMCARRMKHTRYEPKLWPMMIMNVENSATTSHKCNNVIIMKGFRNVENSATAFR